MKRLILAAMIALITSAVSFAQEPKPATTRSADTLFESIIPTDIQKELGIDTWDENKIRLLKRTIQVNHGQAVQEIVSKLVQKQGDRTSESRTENNKFIVMHLQHTLEILKNPPDGEKRSRMIKATEAMIESLSTDKSPKEKNAILNSLFQPIKESAK